MKDVGTLEEIGAKVGDVVQDGNFPAMEVLSYDRHGDRPWTLRSIDSNSPEKWYGDAPTWRMIRRAADADKPGPVREVTRKEIVPGVYGNVWVDVSSTSGSINVGFKSYSMTPDELAAAIATLTEIHNAMKEGGK